MSIIGIKLVTGEDVIGDAGITKDGQIQVSLPVQIKLLPSHIPGGPPSIGFAPWPEYGLEGAPVLLEPLHVAYKYKLDPSILSEYNTMQSQGEQKTTSQQIITG